jgi:hypothetical protein
MNAAARFSSHRIAFQDGSLPAAVVADQFMHTMNKLPKNAWAHLHCDTGGYRTSLCYTMWDMMKNFQPSLRIRSWTGSDGWVEWTSQGHLR